MPLIGRLTSGLVGILLILNTTVLWASEPDTPVTPLLIRWYENDSYKSGLEATLPGLHDSYTVLPAIPNHHFVYTDISDDGWVYMWVGEENVPLVETSVLIGSVYRMRGDGSQRQRIVKEVILPRISFSRDGQWLVFQRIDSGDFYRIRIDGTSLQNLTANFSGYIPIDDLYMHPVISPDNQWLLFKAYPVDYTSPITLYRIPFDPNSGQAPEILLENEELYKANISWPFESEWALIHLNDLYYRFNPSTLELLPLFDVPQDVKLRYVSILLPKHHLLLVKGVRYQGDIAVEYYHWGLRLEDDEPLWVLKPFHQYGLSTLNIRPYSDDDVFWEDSTGIYRMRWDGKWGESLRSQPINWYGDLSPDKQWIYFQLSGQWNISISLYRGRISDGQVEKLGEFVTTNSIGIAPSPDGKWVAVSAVDHGPQTPQSEVYLMRPDGSDLHQVAQIEGDASVIWSIPVVRTWQPIPLMLIAIALLVIGLIPRRLLKRGRRTW